MLGDLRLHEQVAEKWSLAALDSSLQPSFTGSKLQSSLLAALPSTLFQQPANAEEVFLQLSEQHAWGGLMFRFDAVKAETSCVRLVQRGKKHGT